MPRISFVIPVLNEEKNIPLIYSEISDVIGEFPHIEPEWIFVNDGSEDNTMFVLDELSQQDKRVKVIHLTRNFGHQAALTAGMDFATGQAIITMDSDGQDPPSALPEMIARWEEGYRIVYGKRITRKDPFLKRITAKMYYALLRKFSEIKIPGNIGDYRLIDRSVLDYLSKIEKFAMNDFLATRSSNGDKWKDYGKKKNLQRI
ncbi:MAG: hypothetical protein CVU05_12375 [Bacteroidetes bacterium HGW-Bacteroidetes-21]|nr:MAG: hypothetical protein CVU05_12375 [Bacteroidetes bacterium HGW-Bacteroidetes-21]